MILSDFMRENMQSVLKDLRGKVDSQKGNSKSNVTLMQDLERDSELILMKIATLMDDNLYMNYDHSEVKNLFTMVSVMMARSIEEGLALNEAIKYILNLKNIVFDAILSLKEKEEGRTVFAKEVADYLAFFDVILMKLFDVCGVMQEKVIAQQSRVILELSTPALRVWEGIVLLPLVGELDASRANEFMEKLLESIVKYEARVVVIDITGVLVVDTKVAHYLLESMTAAKILGAETILTGISPNTALTLVKLGIDLHSFISVGTLRCGILKAFSMLNVKLCSRKKCVKYENADIKIQ